MKKNPKIIIGTFQINNQDIMDKVVRETISAGLLAFDTAPSYGTEKMLGYAISNAINSGMINRTQIYIQDKIDAMQMYNSKQKSVKQLVKEQIATLQVSYLDALLIHWPFKDYIVPVWKEMCDLKKAGLVSQIGVCNLDKRGYKELFECNNLDIPDLVQNEISPLNNDVNNIAFFKKLGMSIQAYSPLCRMNHLICDNRGIKIIANTHHADIARVILKWHICKGIAPIFSSQKQGRIFSNSKLDFELEEDEIKYIDSLNIDYKIFPISYGCPGY